MFKEISVRIVIFLVLIIVACLIYKYLPPSLKNAKVKAILTIATTLLGVLQFLIPSLSNPFFNDNVEESSNESSQSEILTTTAITNATITTNKSVTSLTTTKTSAIAVTEAPTEKSGKTYIDAIPLTIGESYERAFTYLDDRDNCVWYIVSVSEDGLLSLTLNASVGVYCNINLICINGSDSINYDRGQDRILTINTPVQAGEYYIKISYEQSGAYSLNSQLSTSDYSNDMEVNSPYQNAKLIESNILNGHIGYRSNSPNETDTDDFYKLTFDSFRLFTFNLTMDSDLKTKLFLIASDGATEIYSDYGKNKEIMFTYPLQPGTYYIRIVCLENYGGYQLQINSNEIISLDNEPNNTYQKSIEITSDETIIGSIGFVNDKKEYDQCDWYTFNANERSHITIRTSSPNPFQYEVNLIGMDGEQSLSYSKCRGEIETIEYDLDPGKYYIRVFSYNYGEYEFSYSLNSDFGDD
ncbi:MAG: hypothetical protein J6B01_12005 [Ruminococcus sp.]|nr:hypothetical protein [Ruminococcus sp.]